MGTVIRFDKAPPKKPIEPSPQSGQLRDYLAALAGELRAIEAGRSAIEKNLQVIQAIAESTAIPELKAHLLEQMRPLHDQVLMVSLSLLSGKKSMEEALILHTSRVEFK